MRHLSLCLLVVHLTHLLLLLDFKEFPQQVRVTRCLKEPFVFLTARLKQLVLFPNRDELLSTEIAILSLLSLLLQLKFEILSLHFSLCQPIVISFFLK